MGSIRISQRKKWCFLTLSALYFTILPLCSPHFLPLPSCHPRRSGGLPIEYYPFNHPLGKKVDKGYTGEALPLFVFSLLALPLFLYFKTDNGRRMISKMAVLMEKRGGLFLAAIPLAVTQATLRARWPGFQNLYDDWANFTFYLIVFSYGYLLCSDIRFSRAIEKHAGISLVSGLCFNA